ncbi:MAG: aminotransferase class I/II-fold pyridoxal phosphate-dependent enzyme [Clostridiaceae bacterium]|nr:aminotransferase class I/II-fold pyridoxal phosphate-dependent enzyme [Clostridiaceae bacterium]
MEYMHGGDVYRNPVEYDFSININPLGMPEGSARAAREGVRLSALRYPDWKSEALCRELEKKRGIPAEQIVPGNGAAELIFALCQFLRPMRVRLVAPTFQEYEAACRAVEAKTVVWPLSAAEGFTLGEDFIESIRGEEQLVFLCNPNNPTGNLWDKKFLLRLAKQCRRYQTYLCMDECFLPFLRQECQKEYTMLTELEQYSNVIVLRAFTKIYGMPGLRLGYLCCSNRRVTDGVRRMLQPWNLSIPAQMAGIAALKDEGYLEQTYCLLEEEKAYLQRELLNGLADRIFPSSANFFFFYGEQALQQKLLQKGILIRSCENFSGLSEGYYRIAVRSHEENAELIRRWRECGRNLQHGGGKWQNQL